MLPTTPVTGAAKERFLVRPLNRHGRPLAKIYIGPGESIPLGAENIVFSKHNQSGVPEILFDSSRVKFGSNLTVAQVFKSIDDQSLTYKPIKPGEVVTIKLLPGARRGGVGGLRITLQP